MWRTTRACARSPRLAGAERRARAHDMRVNGPTKSGPSPCGGMASFCHFIFGCLAVKFRILTDRYKDLNRTRVFRVQIGSQIVIDSRTRPYIRRLAASVKLIPIFASAHNCAAIVVLFIPTADVHLRSGEQVSGILRPSRSCIGRGRIRFLGSVLTQLLADSADHQSCCFDIADPADSSLRHLSVYLISTHHLI